MKSWQCRIALTELTKGHNNMDIQETDEPIDVEGMD